MVRPIRSLLRSIAPVAALAALLACALPASASAAEPVFQLTGRGNGHGIGMSQWGAKGFADHGVAYTAILANYYQHTKLMKVPARSVTVYLQKDNAAMAGWTVRSVAATLSVTGFQQDGLPITAAIPGSGGKQYTFTTTGDGFTRMWLGATLVGRYKGPLSVRELAPAGKVPMMVVISRSGPWDWGGVAYRGSLQFVPNGTTSTLRLNNVIGLEDYVLGVVPRESPASWPADALKAQAVAARSYVMSGSRIVYCTTRSQVYNGYGRWDAAAGTVDRHTNGSDSGADKPVADTAGMVLVDSSATATSYKIVTAYFFDSSGGRTEDIQNVWTGTSADPHFVSVSDPYESSTNHIWYERRDASGKLTFNGQPCYSASVLRGKLLAAGVPVPGTITDVQITKRGHSGRVMEILIKGASGDDKTLSGSVAIAKFRRAFGWGDTWFYVTRFSFDSASVTLPTGGSVKVGFHVSGAPASVMNGTIKGLLKDGVNTGRVLTAANGYGTVTFTQPGNYTVDSGVYNASGRPDPAAGDMRGTQWYVRNPLYGVKVVAAPTFVKTARITGVDRYAVSVAASKASFPGTSGAVILVNGGAYADALTASALAGSVPGGAPVLFTTRDVLPASVKAEIARLRPTRAYIVGGPGSVGEPVMALVRAVPGLAGTATRRITGLDRFDVARNVASEVKALGGAAGRVIVVNGYNYADAVAAAGLAYKAKLPILLVTASGVPSATAAAVSALAPSQTLVVGGTGSVSASVRATLPGAKGIAEGVDRYDMAARLATYLTTSEGFVWTRPYLASGTTFADALVGGPLSGRSNGPLLFVRATSVPAPTAASLTSYKSIITTATILGGTGTVSTAVQTAVENLLQ